MSGLPKGWANVPLGSVAEVNSGIGFPKEFQGNNEGDLGFFKVGDVSNAVLNNKGLLVKADNYVSFQVAEKLKGKPIKAGSTVFAKIGEAIRLNRRALVVHDCLVDNNVMSVKAYGDLSDKYFYYFLKTTDFSEQSRATTVPSLRKGDVEDLALPLAPLPEQKRIADRLDATLARVDACRARLARVAPILKRFRQSVLAAATSGQLTADWRERQGYGHAGNANKALQGNTHVGQVGEALPDSVNPSDNAVGSSDLYASQAQLKQLSSWQIKTIEELVFIQNGKTFPSSEYTVAGIRLLRPGNLHASGVVVWSDSNTTYLNASYLEGNEKYVLGKGDLVMNLTAQSLKDEFLGRVCMLQCDEPVLLNQRICSFAKKYSELDMKYLFFIFKSPKFREYVATLDTGSLIKHMYSKQLTSYKVLLPTLAEQTEIVRRVETLFAFADRLEARLASATAAAERLTPSLLAKAFRGELVPQDPNDEPASELLKRLAAQREAMPKAKRGRKGTV